MYDDERMERIENDIKDLRNDVNSIKTDLIPEIKIGMSDIKSDIKIILQEISWIKNSHNKLTDKISKCTICNNPNLSENIKTLEEKTNKSDRKSYKALIVSTVCLVILLATIVKLTF